MSDIFVVGIAGGSGSGKTTITNKLVELVDESITVISHDSYYRAHHEMSYEERTRLNYDHPDSYESELLVEHLKELKQGNSVAIPVYSFPRYDRTELTTTVNPSPVIVVEGIMIFAHPELREQFDLKVFVDCEADVRILRRMRRDVEERGRSVESVMNQYLATVKPMHDTYVEPSKRFADVIIPSDNEGSKGLDLLVCYIQTHL